MGWLSRNKGPSAAEPAPETPPVPPVPSESSVPLAPADAGVPPSPSGPPAAAEPVTSPAASEPIPVHITPGAESGAEPEPEPEPEAEPESVVGPAAPMGQHGPLVTVTRFEDAAIELEWQLPVTGELYRLMPGSDRPDYSLMVLDRPLHFYPADGFDVGRASFDQRVEDRKGRPMVRVNAMLLCARFVGQQLHPGMRDLAVNLAYVIDQSLAHDEVVDFGKIEFAAIGYLSEGHPESHPEVPGTPPAPESAGTAPRPAPVVGARTAAPRSAPDLIPPPADGVVQVGVPPMVVVDEVVPEVARLLKEGIEQQRGSRVERLNAVLTLDERHRISGLSGNADGQPPAPTPETFGRINEALAALADLPARDAVARLTIRVDGDRLSSDVDYRGS